ncbi:MAG: SDR family oxidoreductase [Patescibacteria group bacterium]|nr:SDR family oxidoreductase [Patescibacteria group bacterium]
MNAFKGKIALVTGGGQGLGQEICRSLAKEGALVIVADVNKQKAEKAAKWIKYQRGKAQAIELDVSDELSVKKVFDELDKQFGVLDILINNAGIDFTKSLDEILTDEWQKVLKVNLIGAFLMTKHAFSVMGKKEPGQVINICSTASKRAWANASAYHASKWGLLGFSHAAHVEGREKNIKVTALVSGGMKTPFILERFPEAEPNLQDPKNVAEVIKFVLSLPKETAIPEVMVIPMRETSWP